MMKIKVKLSLTLYAILILAFVTSCKLSGCGDSDDTGSISSTGDAAYFGPIETEYRENGPWGITWIDVEKEAVDGEYGLTIFYPAEMMTGYHPIITWGNGTGAQTDTYWQLLAHLSSWGFVVVSTDCDSTLSGEEMIAGIDYLIEQNNTLGSPFYNKLDTGKIGATGHSQGGGGSVNAANDPRVVCSAPLAPARGNASGLHGPMLLIVGRLDNLVTEASVRKLIYNDAEVPTLLTIRRGINHSDFTDGADSIRGYLTAWFMYQLQNDAEAAPAFVEGCEICSNPNWIVDTDKWFAE